MSTLANNGDNPFRVELKAPVWVMDIEWCQRLIDAIKPGGIWGVPRSGLVFTKTGPNELTLTETMPHDPQMPVTPEEFAELQELDFELIQRHFGEAGVTVKKED